MSAALLLPRSGLVVLRVSGIPVVVVLLFGAGCPALVRPDPGVARVGEACDSDIPCASGLTCNQGRCEAVDGGHAGSSSGGVSSSSSSGGDGGPVECTVRLQCALHGSIDGRDCLEGRCVFMACTDDAQCGSRGCVEGFCADVTSCEDDAECPDGICEAGRCTTGCQDDAECNSGSPLPINTCVEGRCLQRCLGDFTCTLAGGICVDGVCTPPQCSSDAQCEEDEECAEGRCQTFTACSSDAQCTGPGEYCDDMGRCRERPLCTRDVDCGAGGVCQAGRCEPAVACSDTMSACAPEEECVAGRCVPALGCRGNADCTAPEICRAGVCSEPPVAMVARVVIATPAGLCDPLLDTRAACTLYVRPGDAVAVSAVALDAAGRLLSGVSFDWLSDATAVAQVMTGPSIENVIQAGMDAGTAVVTAGHGSVTSPELEVVNLGVPTAGIRVSVVSAASGDRVRNATVIINDQEQSTGTSGSALFDHAMLTPPYTITVFHAQFDYVTLAALPATDDEDLDLILPVAPAQALDTAAGLRGTVNIEQAPTEGPVSFSLSGVSAPNVTGLSFARLLGETFNVEVSLPVIGAQSLPMPGGITISAEVPILGEQQIKTSFDVLGTGGRRVAWTFGGRLPFTALQGLLGIGNPAGAIFALAPYFEGLTHGLSTGLLLTELPYVRDGDTDFDGEPDVNNNGDQDELVPDYLAFPQVSLTVRQEQTLRTGIRFSGFPTGAGNNALITAGARVPGHGFVPLGLTAAEPSTEPISVKLAPRYGGLEAGEYVVAVFAFGMGGNAAPGQMSVRTVHSEVLEAEVDLGAMLPFPEGSTFRAGQRRLLAEGVAGSDLHRAILTGPDGAWRVYFAGGGGSSTVQLPETPLDLPARAERGVALEALQLSDDVRATPETQLRALVSAGGAGLQVLANETEGLSRAPLSAP